MTYRISLPPEPLALRVVRLETPAAPIAPRTPAAKAPSRREKLRAGLEQITDPELRRAFRRKFWRELL